MSYLEHTAVDAHLVHKEHDDDVLVSNFRAELPAYLSVDVLNSDRLTDEQRALLAFHYRSVGPGIGAAPESTPVIWRQSIAAVLPEAVIEKEGFDFVLDYYEKRCGALVLATRYLREEHDIALMNLFIDEEKRITERERFALSNALDGVDSALRPPRYYMNMINDTSNYFFYRKHHEHVPGIMLIEVARQAIYAQYYQTSRHKRGDITLTIRKLDCDFVDFVDANYPVSVCVETTTNPEEFDATSIERRKASFWQKGKCVSSVDIAGKAIGLKLFRRLRAVRPADNHWFIPVKAFSPTALFFDDGGRRSEGKLEKVSRGAMVVRFDRRPENVDPVRFVLKVDSIGYIDGRVRFETVEENRDAWDCRLTFSEISNEGERKWLEAIKNFSQLEIPAGRH